MDEAINPSTEGVTESSTGTEAPSDFREYVTWRQTGELPEQEQTQPAVAEDETPQAKSEPQSGAEEDTQQADDDEEEQLELKPEKGSRRQRKIEKLYRENEELRQQLLAVVTAKPPEPSPEQKPAGFNGKPRLEQFKTLEEYQESLTRWVIDERDAHQKAEAEQRSAVEAQQKLQDDWNSRQKAARKLHADYDDAIRSIEVPKGPGVMAMRQAILEDEAGAEVTYFLAKHPAELERLTALPPLQAVKEVGKLAGRLTRAAAEKPQPKIASVPKPPPSIGRPAKTSADSIYDEAVQQDFSRWAKARTRMEK